MFPKDIFYKYFTKELLTGNSREFFARGGECMLGDEVGNKAIGVTVKASQITAKLVLEVIRSIANDKYKVVNGKQSLKELNKREKL